MRRPMLLMCAILAFSAVLSAQTVDEIIAKNIAARGGAAKLKAIKTLRVTGNVEAGGMQLGFVRLAVRPNKMRLDINIQGLSLVQAYDGQGGWQIVPFTGKKDPEPAAGDDLKELQEEADIDGPLMDYQQKGHKAELVGKEKVEGTDVYNIKVTLKNGEVRNIYLDADSFLEVKMTGKTTRRGTEFEFDSTLGDYKQVEGVMFPFSIDRRMQGGEGQNAKIVIEKVEVNTAIEDSVFKMPPIAPPAEKAAPTAPSGQKQPPKQETGTKPPPQ